MQVLEGARQVTSRLWEKIPASQPSCPGVCPVADARRRSIAIQGAPFAVTRNTLECVPPPRKTIARNPWVQQPFPAKSYGFGTR